MDTTNVNVPAYTQAAAAQDAQGDDLAGTPVSNTTAMLAPPESANVTATMPPGPMAATVAPTATQPISASAVTKPMDTMAAQPAPGQVQDNTPNHPAIQKANLLRDIAWGLSGGQRYDYSVDQSGNTIKTERPVSGGRLALAAALSVIGKGLTGASFNQAKPGAAAEFFNKEEQQKKLQDQAARQQAQQQFANQETVKLRQAQNAEVNSRTMLNIMQAQKLGLEAINDQMVLSTDSYNEQKEAGNIADGGDGITDAQFRQGLKDNKFDMMAQEGGVKGVAYENGKPVPTYFIVNDPNRPAQLTQDKWDQLSQYFPSTFKPGSKVGDNTTISFAQMNKYTQEMGVVQNMQHEQDQISGFLRNSDDPTVQKMADNLAPLKSLLKDPESNPQLMEAMLHSQRYISGHDPGSLYEQLKTMAHPYQVSPPTGAQLAQLRKQYAFDKQSGATTGTFAEYLQTAGTSQKANPDAPFAEAVANAFGGWEALGRLHEESPEIKGSKQDYNASYNALNPSEKTTNIIPITGPQAAVITPIIDRAATSNGLDVGVFRALGKVESNFNPQAEGITPGTGQKSGAQGLYQLVHATQKEMGLSGDDWKDPVKNEMLVRLI